MKIEGLKIFKGFKPSVIKATLGPPQTCNPTASGCTTCSVNNKEEK